MHFTKLKILLRWLSLRQVNGLQRKHVSFDDAEPSLCLNCGMTFQGNYCPNCGQSRKVKRLSISSAIDNLLGIFVNLDRGLPRTCAELIYRPGYMIRDYLEGRRVEYIKPIQLLFLLVTIFVAMQHLLGAVDVEATDWEKLQNAKLTASGQQVIIPSWIQPAISVIKWIESNGALSLMLLYMMFIIPNWWCFRRTEYGKKLNITEHFYISIFIACQGVMLSIVMFLYDCIFAGLLNGKSLEVSVTGTFSIGICIFLMTVDFKQMMSISYWRSFRICLSSIVLTFSLLVLLCILVSLIIALVFPYK